MENNITPGLVDAIVARHARQSAEQRLRRELHDNYRRLHRRTVRRRAAAYVVALALVALTASAAIPAMEYDYITNNHAAVPSATLAGVRTTLAAL